VAQYAARRAKKHGWIAMVNTRMPQEMEPRCELCGRLKRLTRHHLIPRRVHRKKRFQTRFGEKEMHERSLMICKECHAAIHDLIPDEKELADKYHTKELLLQHEGLRRHIAWVRKQK
jgi:hypothetical protein